jgi:hypothetical protein
VPIPFSWRSTAIASNGTTSLVAGAYCPSGEAFLCDHDVFTFRVGADRSVQRGPDVAVGAADQIDPQIVWSGGRYLVAYRRQAIDRTEPDDPQYTGPVDIRSTLVSGDGATAQVAGVITAPDVFGTKAIARGPNGTFAVAFDAQQTQGSYPVQLRTLSPK